MWLALGASWAGAVALGQTWHSSQALPLFRATEAQAAAATRKAYSAACSSNLQRLALAARLYANDNNDRLPTDWPLLTTYIQEAAGSPAVLYCPADGVHPPTDVWEAVDFGAVSYRWVGPARLGGLLPSTPLAECVVHGNAALADGSAREARPYDPRGFPAAVSGLVFPNTSTPAFHQATWSLACQARLRQIGVAGRVFATDHGDHLPSQFTELASELGSPAVLICPEDLLAPVPTSFEDLNLAALSYQIDSPGAEPEPLTRFASCRIHGHWVNGDGQVLKGDRRYPPRFILGHPLSQTVSPGQSATLKVLLGETAAGPFAFQWRKVTPFDHEGLAANEVVVLAEATEPTYVIPSATAEDEGYYDVVVHDGQGGYELSHMAYLRVEPLAAVTAEPDWEVSACAANLVNLCRAARLCSVGAQVLPSDYAEMAPFLGWPLALFCPADHEREAPESWAGADLQNTSYLLSRGVWLDTPTAVLATCKTHGFQVLADGELVLTAQSCVPILELVAFQPGGELLLAIAGIPGVEAVVEYSADLIHWEPLATRLLTDETWLVTDAVSPGGPGHFYRAFVR